MNELNPNLKKTSNLQSLRDSLLSVLAFAGMTLLPSSQAMAQNYNPESNSQIISSEVFAKPTPAEEGTKPPERGSGRK